MDLDRIKAFLIAHFEKALFGIFACVTALLIWTGLQKEDFMEVERTDPDTLSRLATTVKTDIDNDHTEAILADRRQEDLDIVALTKARDLPVEPSIYDPTKYWSDVDPGSVIRRTDPTLTKPIDLRVNAVVTTIAQTSRVEGGYQLAELEAADKIEVEQPRRQPNNNRGGRRGGRGGGMSMEMMGMSSSMMGMGGMGEMDPSGMGGMGGSRGMGGPSMAGPTRRFSASGDLSGYRPQPEDSVFPQPMVWSFIAGVALLPYKDVYKEYEQALSEADGYNPGRDVPVYHDLQIQRADVTGRSVSDLTEDDWIMRFDRITHYKLARRDWIGFAPEFTPSDYREDELALHIPPVLLDDYHWYTSHERLPTVSRRELQQLELKAAAPEKVRDLDADLESEGTTLVGPGGVMGGGSMYGSGGGSGGFDSYGGASFGGGMSIARGQLEADPVEHKLIRFFDFAGILRTAPVPGRQYVYRIRYGVVDPNFPQIKEMQPKTSTLDPATAARVSQLVAKAEAANSRDGLWVRYSEWSEPTGPIGLADLNQQFAGQVTPASTARVRMDNQVVEIPKDQPTVEMVTSRFDTQLGTRVPIVAEFQPGMTLAAKAESVDVVDPVTLEVKKLPVEQAKVPNLTTLIDVSGAGQSADDEELQLPGHVLMMTADGSLQVSDDVDDQRVFRIYSYAEERGQ